MGGYVAEKEMFGDITTGASNDIKVASDLARKMVTRFGMSEKLGPMTFGESHEMVFLGKEISQGRNYSEKIAADIDKEVTGFINKAFVAAKKIINMNKKALDAIAKTLIEKETLEQEDFYNILKPFNLKPSGI